MRFADSIVDVRSPWLAQTSTAGLVNEIRQYFQKPTRYCLSSMNTLYCTRDVFQRREDIKYAYSYTREALSAENMH